MHHYKLPYHKEYLEIFFHILCMKGGLFWMEERETEVYIKFI